MEDFELTLYDRLEAIKSTNKKYDLENNAYISFSGGKDSCVVSKLIDIALPSNKIPRVYFNTGIEYALMVKFVKELAEKDSRIVIVNSNVNIKKMLETKGYPFKSKEFSLKLKMYRNNSKSKYIKKFIARGYYASCPDKLRFTLQPDFTLNISNLCCYELKKKIAKKYEKDNIRPIAILGLMQNEGGNERTILVA